MSRSLAHGPLSVYARFARLLALPRCLVGLFRRSPQPLCRSARLSVEAMEGRVVPAIGGDDPPTVILPDISYDVAVGQSLAASVGVGVLDNYDLSSFGAGAAVVYITIPGSATAGNPGDSLTTNGGGTLTVEADGSFSFVPGSSGTGPDVFEFWVSDGTTAGIGTATLCVGGSGSDYDPEDLSASSAGTLEYHRESTCPEFSDDFTVFDVPFHLETVTPGGGGVTIEYQVFNGNLAHVEDMATVLLPTNQQWTMLDSDLRNFTFADGQELVTHIVEVRVAVDVAVEDISVALSTGYSTSAMKGQIDGWFQGNGNGAAHQAPTQAQVGTIRDNFQAVADNLDTHTITYQNDEAYLGYGWNDNGTINIGVGYYSGWDGTGATPAEKFGTVIHELTHTNPPNTDDFAYYDVDAFTNLGVVRWMDLNYIGDVTVTTADLISNADSYAGFLTEYYY